MTPIDESREYLMQSHIGNTGGMVTLAWPKGLSLWELDWVLELVTFQLNIFRDTAREEERGEAEYASWFPEPYAELSPRKPIRLAEVLDLIAENDRLAEQHGNLISSLRDQLGNDRSGR